MLGAYILYLYGIFQKAGNIKSLRNFLHLFYFWKDLFSFLNLHSRRTLNQILRTQSPATTLQTWWEQNISTSRRSKFSQLTIKHSEDDSHQRLSSWGSFLSSWLWDLLPFIIFITTTTFIVSISWSLSDLSINTAPCSWILDFLKNSLLAQMVLHSGRKSSTNNNLTLNTKRSNQLTVSTSLRTPPGTQLNFLYTNLYTVDPKCLSSHQEEKKSVSNIITVDLKLKTLGAGEDWRKNLFLKDLKWRTGWWEEESSEYWCSHREPGGRRLFFMRRITSCTTRPCLQRVTALSGAPLTPTDCWSWSRLQDCSRTSWFWISFLPSADIFMSTTETPGFIWTGLCLREY